MSRIDFRVQDNNAHPFEKTDPGRGRSPGEAREIKGDLQRETGDSYSADVSQGNVPSPAKHKIGFFARRRAVQEAGATAQKLARLGEAPEAAIRSFFTHDLPRLVALSKAAPKQIQKELRRESGPWGALVQLACGEASAFLKALENQIPSPTTLFAMEKLAAFKPREAAHLVKQFFERGDLNSRLATLRTIVVSPHLGDGQMIGEFFVKLMAASTPQERKNLVEPTLNHLIQQAPPSGKRAWLNAYYHGWRQENLG